MKGSRKVPRLASKSVTVYGEKGKTDTLKDDSKNTAYVARPGDVARKPAKAASAAVRKHANAASAESVELPMRKKNKPLGGFESFITDEWDKLEKPEWLSKSLVAFYNMKAKMLYRRGGSRVNSKDANEYNTARRGVCESLSCVSTAALFLIKQSPANAASSFPMRACICRACIQF